MCGGCRTCDRCVTAGKSAFYWSFGAKIATFQQKFSVKGFKSLTVFLLSSLSLASSQSVITRFIGDEVLLPCVYSEKLSEPVNAFWRDKDDKVVLDIVKSKVAKIDSKFKGRVVSFEELYKTGNLSIIIKDLRADDAGPYDCDIPTVDYQTRITLNVTEKPAVTTPRPLPPVTASPRAAAVTSSLHHLTLLCPALFLQFLP